MTESEVQGQVLPQYISRLPKFTRNKLPPFPKRLSEIGACSFQAIKQKGQDYYTYLDNTPFPLDCRPS